MSRKHSLGAPCPVVGGDVILECWSLPELEDWPYNACAACTGDKRSLAERLQELDELRSRVDDLEDDRWLGA